MEELINKEEFENICKKAFENYINTVFTKEAEENLWFRIYRQTCHFFKREAYNEIGLEPSTETWQKNLTTLLSNKKSEPFDHLNVASLYINKMMTEGSL